MTVSYSDLGPDRREDFLGLMREIYGSSMSDEEFGWFFRNPAREPIVTAADEGSQLLGTAAMTFGRALVEGDETLLAFAVHVATHPASRGKGIFSAIEYLNEEKAEVAGAPLALGFTNPMAGPIYVGKLGWSDLYRMRLWARPLHPLRALRRRGGDGGLPPSRGGALERFGPEHEAAWRRVAPAWKNCLVRSPEYLNWRYVDAPKEYRAFGAEHGYAVVGHAIQKGVSAAVICDLVGPPREQRGLVRRCLREARGGADVAIAVPAPDQRRAFLSLGFVPTPMTIRVIGKALRPGAELPAHWHFTPGDTDFF
jgi:GNAT superfamily N-acetyltransferase